MAVTLLPGAALRAAAAADTVTAYYNGTGLYTDADCTDDSVITTSAADCSFRGKITNIEFVGTITSIGDDAFAYCGDLSGIDIPASVEAIGDRAFYSCGSLQCTVTSADSKTAAVTGHTGASENVVIPELVAYKGNILSVTSIGDSAFISCTDLM